MMRKWGTVGRKFRAHGWVCEMSAHVCCVRGCGSGEQWVESVELMGGLVRCLHMSDVLEDEEVRNSG